MGLKNEVKRYERGLIRIALEKRKGNVSHAAMDLGVNQSTLWRKIHTFGLTQLARKPGNFRNETRWTFNPKSIKIKSAVKSFEKKLVKAALERTCGNVSAAARDLGVGQSTLVRKVRTHNLGKWVKRLRAIELIRGDG